MPGPHQIQFCTTGRPKGGLAGDRPGGYDRGWSEPCLRERSARRIRRPPGEMSTSAAGGGWLGRVSALSTHRYSTWALAGIAFADSSFLPVPPDLLLVPMVLLRPERVYFLLAICIVASTLGAVV